MDEPVRADEDIYCPGEGKKEEERKWKLKEIREEGVRLCSNKINYSGENEAELTSNQWSANIPAFHFSLHLKKQHSPHPPYVL